MTLRNPSAFMACDLTVLISKIEQKAKGEISISFQLKRIVFFFCIFYFGLGGCLSNLAMAQKKDLFTIWMAGVYKDVNSLKREVSGFVTAQGFGVKNVGIYDGSKLLAVNDGDGFYRAKILLDVQYTLTPKKGDIAFMPASIIILANGYDYLDQNFQVMDYYRPGPVTLLSPSGTTYSSTPTYKWIASSYATSYGLLVDDSTGRGKIYKYYTDSEADCNSGTCSVTPSTSLADGNATWWVVACVGAGCGAWSNAMGFIVSAGPQDPILGLWDAGDGGKALMAESTTGGYKFVATITVQGTGWWKERGIKVGDVAWKLNKQPNGHYIGETAVNGNTWYWWPMEVVIQGNQMIDTAGKLVGTKIQ
jgi:hypothetical protein